MGTKEPVPQAQETDCPTCTMMMLGRARHPSPGNTARPAPMPIAIACAAFAAVVWLYFSSEQRIVRTKLAKMGFTELKAVRGCRVTPAAGLHVFGVFRAQRDGNTVSVTVTKEPGLRGAVFATLDDDMIDIRLTTGR